MNYFAEFDDTKENVRRQITTLSPVRNVHTEVRRRTMQAQINSAENPRYFVESDSIKNDNEWIEAAKKYREFASAGISAYVDNIEQAQKVARTHAITRFLKSNAYLADIASSFYTIATSPAQRGSLADVREMVERNKMGEEEATGIHIVCTESAIRKALLGPIVWEDGGTVKGAGEVVKEAFDAINPVLRGLAPPPIAYASINKKRADGTKIEILLAGNPIRIYRHERRKGQGEVENIYSIYLDRSFFPAVFEGGFPTADDQYINQVAGLTAFLDLGRKLYKASSKPEKIIETIPARRIMGAVQAVFELRAFAPGLVKENLSGRINISIRREAIVDVLPCAVSTPKNGDVYINFKMASEMVAQAGEFFRLAMEYTGITEQLKNKNILVPASERGMEFPENYPKVAYVKVDRFK